jgi:chemotaxis protein methyltransferase CheR
MDIVNGRFFEQYRQFVLSETGISTSDNKKEIFKLKIRKSMNEASMDTYDQHLKILTGNEKDEQFYGFINNITTNTTEFFREGDHFGLLKNSIPEILEQNPDILRDKEMRVWSAGCSSGQEALTLSMLLKEVLPSDVRVRILASDINTKVLKQASDGIYSQRECDSIPEHYRRSYFSKCSDGCQVRKDILERVRYRFFNLMEDFSFKKKFHIIFCRNVMIYFGSETQQQLVQKFYQSLRPQGLLFIGHAESLIYCDHGFEHLGASVYRKPKR